MLYFLFKKYKLVNQFKNFLLSKAKKTPHNELYEFRM